MNIDIEFKQTMLRVIELQSEIISILNNNNINNNTFHFVWYENPETVSVEVASCNPITKQIFLLIDKSGQDFNDCLLQILKEIKSQNTEEYSWTVKWEDEKSAEHISYFRGKTEEEIRNKFYYTDLNIAIIEIQKMPLS